MNQLFTKPIVNIDFDSRKFSFRECLRLAREISCAYPIDVEKYVKIKNELGDDIEVHRFVFADRRRYVYKEKSSVEEVVDYYGFEIVKKVPVGIPKYCFSKMEGICVCMFDGVQDLGGLMVNDEIIHFSDGTYCERLDKVVPSLGKGYQ